MKQLISPILDRLHENERVMLCILLESEGSTPRGAGAKMAVFADGSQLGTVGGGAVERLTANRARMLLEQGRSEVRPYLLTPNGQEDIGMVCGGNVLMGFCCLDPGLGEEMAALEALRTLLDANSAAWMETAFFPSGTARLTVIEKEDVHAEGERLPNSPTLTKTDAAITLLEPVTRQENVYVFGGGHVAAALAPALAAVGFAVTVYDPRPGFADPARFPTAKNWICAPFEAVLETVTVAPEDYLVVMTPGHKADYTVLSQALRTPATYVGCIGSAKKVAFVNQKLTEDGFSPDDLARIHAPIGLPILAQTPEEIAVSITAELILHRHSAAKTENA